MKRTLVALIPLTFLVVSILSMGFLSASASPTDPIEGVPSGSLHSVSYDHWSVLTITETITNLGGGVWKYSYAFTNTETAAIWHFGVWTTFTTEVATVTTFDQTPTWPILDSHDINAITIEYDARNLDPNIVWSSHTNDANYPNSPNPIAVGASVSGFSYRANVYDASPKYYFYEIYGSYAVQVGYVTAVGLTSIPTPVIPEVPLGTLMGFLSMFIALIGFVGVKRFRLRFKAYQTSHN